MGVQNIQSLLGILFFSVMSLLPLPHWSYSRHRLGSSVMQSPQPGDELALVTDLGSVWTPCASNLTSKGNLTCERLCPSPG